MIEEEMFSCECDDESCGLEFSREIFESALDAMENFSNSNHVLILHPSCKNINEFDLMLVENNFILVKME
jgi:hypothetical protein